MVDYYKDVETEAKDFLANNEDMIKGALEDGKDFDLNDIDGLDGAFHYDITDRAYSPRDAVFVLENTDNEETDSGLWEGQDWRDELSTRAAYSFSNDVWFKCEEIYKEMQEEIERRRNALLPEDEKELEEEEEQKILDEVFKEHTTTKLEPVEQGSKEEKRLIERWLELNKGAGMWGGYPVGSSYIDARCGTGHGMPEIKDYVDFDREFSQQVPHLADKRRAEVEAYFNKMWPQRRTERQGR